MLNKDAVTYPETLEDMGTMVKKLQEVLDPYDGCVFLRKAPKVYRESTQQDKSGHNVIYRISVQMSVLYNPQKFHRDIGLLPPQGEHTGQGE
jgi:hypothetical protein